MYLLCQFILNYYNDNEITKDFRIDKAGCGLNNNIITEETTVPQTIYTNKKTQRHITVILKKYRIFFPVCATKLA